MRILIDGRSITKHISGIGRYTDELIKGYIKHYGYENVTVILNSKTINYPYKYIFCPFNRHSFWGAIKFSVFLTKQKYEIYHSGDIIGPLFKKKNVKHILTVHDLMFLIVPNFFGENSLRIKLRTIKNKLLFYFFLINTDEIISISQTTHDDLKKHYKLESQIVREGVNKIKNDEHSIKEYLDLTHKSFFLYVGIAAPHKNIDFLIESFLTANTNKKLVICGKGHIPVKSDRIIYTGWVDDSILNYLYTNCSAFIFPSLYEGFGLPILEALSYHCLVFSSNAGSLKEFSNQVINYFNPYNHNELVKLIENVDLIKIDIQQIDSYLMHFNWDQIWNEYHQIK